MTSTSRNLRNCSSSTQTEARRRSAKCYCASAAKLRNCQSAQLLNCKPCLSTLKGTQTRGFAVEQLSSFADLLNCEVTWQNAALWLVGATAKAFADLQTQKASFSPSQLGRLEKNSTLLLLFASAVLHCQFLTFAFCTLTLKSQNI
jgi:hypothetical protein